MEKKIVAFDIDNTLTESRSAPERDMADLLCRLLEKKIVVLTSGGPFLQMQDQLVKHLRCKEYYPRLFLLPASGSSFYEYKDGEWRLIYEKVLRPEEKKAILKAFDDALPRAGFTKPETLYGEMFEDRDTQITFSAFGQKAPLSVKKPWDPDQKKRQNIVAELHKVLPDFEFRIGGTTSIDVTRKGVDKAYGLAKFFEHSGSLKEDLVYVGDALFEGGNDYVVVKLGIDTLSTSGPEETKQVIQNLLQ